MGTDNPRKKQLKQARRFEEGNLSEAFKRLPGKFSRFGRAALRNWQPT